MFEAFGFSGDLPTLQKIISATFERGHFGGRAALSEFSVFFLLGHLTSIADYFFPQVSTWCGQCVDGYSYVLLLASVSVGV